MIKASSVLAIALFVVAPAFACDGVMPPSSARLEPTVPYSVMYVSGPRFAKLCPLTRAVACAQNMPTKAQPDRWLIILDAKLSTADRQCFLIYEKSHLAPNFWGDPAVEAPETITWLSEQKSRASN